MTVAALRARLAALATPAQKASAEAYFKGVVPFLGVKLPRVDTFFKELRPELDALPAPDRLALATALLDEDVFELRQLGVLVLNREVRRLPPGWLPALEPVLLRRATNWGTADSFAGRVLRFRLPVDEERAHLVGWAANESPWLRRMACVAFVNEARKGLYADEIRAVVAGALALDHRFAQLGAGWLLRERWLAAPAEVEALLARAAPRMRREALRYAIEKMPPERRAALLTGAA